MVASQELIGSAGEHVADLVARMEASASAGDWSRVEALAVRLRSAVLDLPAAERESILAAQRSTDYVQAVATAARRDVAERLSSVRRGRVAARAYGTGEERPATAAT